MAQDDDGNAAGATPRPKPGDEAPAGVPGAGEAPCRRCKGTGRIDGEPCPECDGTGVILQEIGGG
jgi:RecJ-like exonuclease